MPKLRAKEFLEVQILVSSFVFGPVWYDLRVRIHVALRVMSSNLDLIILPQLQNSTLCILVVWKSWSTIWAAT